MEVSIEVGNSYSQVKGLDRHAYSEVRKALSYETDAQAAYFSGGFRRTKYCIDAKGYFATGLLDLVVSTLAGLGVKPTVKSLVSDKPVVKTNIRFSESVFPYLAQYEAMAEAIKAGRGTIAMPTGTGKSLVIALIASRLGVRTLVVVPNLEIKKQLQAAFKAFIGNNSDVVIENIDSSALKKLTDFDCLIIDEAHHVAAKTYQNLNKTAWTNIRYRFFFTATPFRNNEEEKLLFEGIAGRVIYKLQYRRAIKENYIVPVEAFYLEVPRVNTDAYTYQQVYKEQVIMKQSRNEMIAQLCAHLNGQHVLVLVKEIAHGQILSEMTGVPFANGQDDDSRSLITDFNQGTLKQLIGTTGIIGEGVDTKPCEYVIIAGLGKAKSAFMQQVGRAVRKYEGKQSAKVILFKDRSHKFLTRHFKAQCDILLEEYGVQPTKLELK